MSWAVYDGSSWTIERSAERTREAEEDEGNGPVSVEAISCAPNTTFCLGVGVGEESEEPYDYPVYAVFEGG